MSTERLTEVEQQPKPTDWVGAVAAYGAASLLQILAYGAGASGNRPGRTADAATIAIALAWLLGPAASATWFSVRQLRFWKDLGTGRLGVPRALALLLL